jgi:hypothetical protein
MSDDQERLALKDLAVVFSGDERQHNVGTWLNPIGGVMWINTAGMAIVFVCKKYLIVRKLRVRALRVRGWFNPDERDDLYQFSADVPETGGFIKDCLHLLVVGRGFEGTDAAVSLRPRARGEDFYLTRRV